MAEASSEILRADPAYRKKCLLVLLLMLIIGMAAILWGWPLLADRFSRLETDASLSFFRWLMTASFLPCFLFAGYLIFLGRRVMRSRQFPPPGMRVVKDTEVVRGDDVFRVLRMLAVSVVLLIIGGLIGAVWFPWVFLQQFLLRY